CSGSTSSYGTTCRRNTSQGARRRGYTRGGRMNPSSPQAREMADESMVRTLTAQAEAIWPQEQAIFARHDLPERAEVLDVGCGTGEIIVRLAERYPSATFLGVDLEEEHLERARVRCARFGERVRFQRADALA